MRFGPRPGQELVETIIGPEVDEAGQDIGEPRLRVDAGYRQ